MSLGQCAKRPHHLPIVAVLSAALAWPARAALAPTLDSYLEAGEALPPVCQLTGVERSIGGSLAALAFSTALRSGKLCRLTERFPFSLMAGYIDKNDLFDLSGPMWQHSRHG